MINLYYKSLYNKCQREDKKGKTLPTQTTTMNRIEGLTKGFILEQFK
jgi:hypothetical protein